MKFFKIAKKSSKSRKFIGLSLAYIWRDQKTEGLLLDFLINHPDWQVRRFLLCDYNEKPLSFDYEPTDSILSRIVVPALADDKNKAVSDITKKWNKQLQNKIQIKQKENLIVEAYETAAMLVEQIESNRLLSDIEKENLNSSLNLLNLKELVMLISNTFKLTNEIFFPVYPHLHRLLAISSSLFAKEAISTLVSLSGRFRYDDQLDKLYEIENVDFIEKLLSHRRKQGGSFSEKEIDRLKALFYRKPEMGYTIACFPIKWDRCIQEKTY